MGCNQADIGSVLAKTLAIVMHCRKFSTKRLATDSGTVRGMNSVGTSHIRKRCLPVSERLVDLDGYQTERQATPELYSTHVVTEVYEDIRARVSCRHSVRIEVAW